MNPVTRREDCSCHRNRVFFDVSVKHNVVVLVLDMTDTQYLEEVYADNQLDVRFLRSSRGTKFRWLLLPPHSMAVVSPLRDNYRQLRSFKTTRYILVGRRYVLHLVTSKRIWAMTLAFISRTQVQLATMVTKCFGIERPSLGSLTRASLNSRGWSGLVQGCTVSGPSVDVLTLLVLPMSSNQKRMALPRTMG